MRTTKVTEMVETQNGVTTIKLTNSADFHYVTITADENTGLITDVWHGEFGSADNFEAAIQNIIDLFIDGEGSYYRWFADLRDMKGSWDSKMSWMFDRAMPIIISCGLLYEAIVQPKHIFARMSTADTIKKLPKGGEIQHFPDSQYDRAKAWINSKVAEKVVK